MNNKGTTTKLIIIEKAAYLFSIKGYYHTSINDIIRETGISRGGIYSHYKSKEAIWYAVYDTAVYYWKQIIFNDLRSITCPVERIKSVVQRHLYEYTGKDNVVYGAFFVSMLMEFTNQNDVIAKHILKGFSKYQFLVASWLDEAKVNGILRENVDTIAAGSFIVNSFYGPTSVFFASKDSFVIKNTVDQLHFYIDSLLK